MQIQVKSCKSTPRKFVSSWRVWHLEWQKLWIVRQSCRLPVLCSVSEEHNTSVWHGAHEETANKQPIYLYLERNNALHLNEHDVTEQRLQPISDAGGSKVIRQLVTRKSARWMKCEEQNIEKVPLNNESDNHRLGLECLLHHWPLWTSLKYIFQVAFQDSS